MAGNAFSVHLLRLLDYQEMAGWPAARGSEGPARTQREAAGERVVPVPMPPSPLSPRHAGLSPSPSQLCPCASGAQDARRGQGWSCSPIWESGGGAEHPSTNLFSILRAGRARRGWSCYGQRKGEYLGPGCVWGSEELGCSKPKFFGPPGWAESRGASEGVKFMFSLEKRGHLGYKRLQLPARWRC